MKWFAVIVATLLIAGPALASDDKAPVPKDLQAAWARGGHCNTTDERFEIHAFRAGWGKGYGGPIHFDAARRALVWDDEKRTDTFFLGPRGLQMFHELSNAPGADRERLVKCPESLVGRRR